MAGKKATPRAKGRGKATRSAVPDIYQEMLAEALPGQFEVAERPLKRRKTGQRHAPVASSSSKPVQPADEDAGDEDLEFEDVLHVNHQSDIFENEPASSKPQQTAYRDSGDESGGSDEDWEGIDFDVAPDGTPEPSGDLELTLTKKLIPQSKAPPTPRKRRLVSKDERVVRVQIHKMHVLCLLSYLDRRNEWCNDVEVQESLRLLIDRKSLNFLRPSSELSQFAQANSLKRGVEQVSKMWKSKFKITERGMRRALWAEDEKDLQNYQLPDDADSIYEKSDFREAAKKFKGSRDLGAQLYCALLRSADVKTRLVCSLQPLSFARGGPPMPRPPMVRAKTKVTPQPNDKSEAVNISSLNTFASSSSTSTSNAPMTPRRRLGHPNAASYRMPETRAPPPPPPPKYKIKPMNESLKPVFWVEVFDEAHQKWFPVDPLVTESIAKPGAFDPPATDNQNSMSYVIAFEDEGCARDVTKRYAKAYNAKTRKSRVESTHGGGKWLLKAMRRYRRGFTSDVDQIENTELATAEAREPMPRNIADFKDHPYYALERHLKRNEILISTHECGKVAAGRDPDEPRKKKMESIYRRKDVKVVRSADSWYRLGRDVKIGEQPVKVVPAKKRLCEEDEDMGDEADERAGTNLYTEDQTELYVPPPVCNGRIPRNSFGNLDIFVPSMVPAGGTHIPDPLSPHAARLLGIDFAAALTRFKFQGRHGTAVLTGVVVAEEFKEAMEAVLEGFKDEQARFEEERRTLQVLKMWKRFLVGLRIKERVDGYAFEGEDEGEGGLEKVVTADEEGGENGNEDVMGEDEDEDDSDEYIDDGGGGFFPE